MEKNEKNDEENKEGMRDEDNDESRNKGEGNTDKERLEESVE